MFNMYDSEYLYFRCVTSGPLHYITLIFTHVIFRGKSILTAVMNDIKANFPISQVFREKNFRSFLVKFSFKVRKIEI